MTKTVFNIARKSDLSVKNFEIPKSINPVIPDNDTWLMNDNGEIYVIAGQGKFSSFSKSFSGLKIGDIIEVSCELFCFSGDLPKIAISNKENLGLYTTDGYIYPKKQWVPINIKYIVQSKENGFKVVVGGWTNDVSDFKIRNLSIGISSKQSISKIEERLLCIVKKDGAFSSDLNYSNEEAVFSIANENTLTVTLKNGLIANLAVFPFYSNDMGNTVTLKLGSANNWAFNIRAFDQAGKMIKIADVPNGTIVFVNLKQMY